MNINKRFLIQMTIGLGLIVSWFIYENQRDDSAEYLTIISHYNSNRLTMNIIARSSENLIRRGESMTEKSPSQKPLVGVMKEILNVNSGFYNEIDKIRSEIFQYNGKEFKEFKIPRPVKYNSTAPVYSYFNKKDTFEALEKNWQNTIDKLKMICAKDIFKEMKSLDRISETEINEYYKKQALILQNSTPIITQLIEQQGLRKTIKKYDAVHANALLLALQYELKMLESSLLYNIARLLREEKTPLEPIIVMSMEKIPRVGEPIELEFYPSNYIVMDNFKIKLNGKSYQTNKGIATFNYTPKSAGTKYFKVDISITNPFTNKTDNFSKIERFEAFE